MMPKAIDFLRCIVGALPVRLFGVLAVVLPVACGKVVEPEFVIEESIVTTPAGTEHVQVLCSGQHIYNGFERWPVQCAPSARR